jgi:hypothetical protein
VVLYDGKVKTPAVLEAVRAEIIEYFHATTTSVEKLYETLNASHASFKKHETFRQPPIFCMGHTSCFLVNECFLGKFSDVRIDPALEMQMAVGVVERLLVLRLLVHHAEKFTMSRGSSSRGSSSTMPRVPPVPLQGYHQGARASPRRGWPSFLPLKHLQGASLR